MVICGLPGAKLGGAGGEMRKLIWTLLLAVSALAWIPSPALLFTLFDATLLPLLVALTEPSPPIETPSPFGLPPPFADGDCRRWVPCSSKRTRFRARVCR